MFKLFQREKWVLVKTIEDTVFETKHPENSCIVYFHLFESSKGRRKIDIVTRGISGYPDESVINVAKSLGTYQTKIYRWLHGRVDPEIPTYNQIPEEETANMLKGKI